MANRVYILLSGALPPQSHLSDEAFLDDWRGRSHVGGDALAWRERMAKVLADSTDVSRQAKIDPSSAASFCRSLVRAEVLLVDPPYADAH